MTSPLLALQKAQEFAFNNKPLEGGFPFLAECMRRAGVRRNTWYLPACTSVYEMENTTLVTQMPSLIQSMVEVPMWNQDTLIAAIRTDQAGQTQFVEFLQAAFAAGVLRYEVDFEDCSVTYYGVRDVCYKEIYPKVNVIGFPEL
jgi:uncharacterized protein YbcV (DUF1398 family)